MIALTELLLLTVGSLLCCQQAHGFTSTASFEKTRQSAIAFPLYATQKHAALNGACSRRRVLSTVSGAAVASLALRPELAHASSPTVTTPISATWSAIEGLNSLDQFVSFDASAYRAMRDDPTRTPLFQQAIVNRLGNNPETKVVLDLGTGPFALFAIIAAEAGARKVYAIEANPAAALSARSFVKKAGFDDVITIIEEFSTKVELPEKCDLCVAEIVGSIATEEGAYATVRDAHARFMKEPNSPSSWIPSRIQTYAAPASYTLHNLFGPPEFDWAKLKGEPVRFSCRDKGLGLLADPVLVEDIQFSEIQKDQKAKKQLSFRVNEDRLKENTLSFYDEFIRGKSTPRDSEILAMATGHSFSGIALWPRLILDDTTIIDTRHYGDGGYQGSHWQTVLPIMASRPVANLVGGEMITVTTDFQLFNDVSKPPVYSIKGEISV